MIKWLVGCSFDSSQMLGKHLEEVVNLHFAQASLLSYIRGTANGCCSTCPIQLHITLVKVAVKACWIFVYVITYTHTHTPI